MSLFGRNISITSSYARIKSMDVSDILLLIVSYLAVSGKFTTKPVSLYTHCLTEPSNI